MLKFTENTRVRGFVNNFFLIIQQIIVCGWMSEGPTRISSCLVFPWLKFYNNRLSIHCIDNMCIVTLIFIFFLGVWHVGSLLSNLFWIIGICLTFAPKKMLKIDALVDTSSTYCG